MPYGILSFCAGFRITDFAIANPVRNDGLRRFFTGLPQPLKGIRNDGI
jgi:hypothetical protein